MATQKSQTRFARRIACSALWLALLGLGNGCASHTTLVIARCDARFNLSAPHKIALAPHAQPRASELALQRALVAALQERGMAIVPPAEAEFTLTYWLDDSWKTGKKVVYYYDGDWSDTHPMAQPGAVFMGSQGNLFYEDQRPIRQRVVDSPYYIQGIRLKLYPKTGPGAGQFQAAWEGYIEGGARVSRRREPVLLRTLLNYYGKDFNGRAPLVE